MKRINYVLAGLVLLTAFTACEKDNDSSNPVTGDGQGRFVVAVQPIASSGVADYLLTAPSLDTGTLSLSGNGKEQDGTYRYYTTSGSKFFSMLYGQANAGAVTVYNLDEQGELSKLTNFQTETVQAFGPVDDDILMVKASRNYDSPTSQWYEVSTSQMLITSEGQFNSVEMAANGELAHFSWLQQVGDKVFAPYFCIKAVNSDWSTDYPDSAWIAVFSYPDMTLETIIRDDRTSSIGMYFTNGITVAENGDAYAFSPSNTVENYLDADNKAFNSTRPSAITRVKSGTTEFDQDYYFDIEAASGDYYITSWIYTGNNTVVATMNPVASKSQWQAAKRLAVINLVNKTFTWVTGTPDEADISKFSRTNYSGANGTAYFGITTTDSKSVVYKVDATTATATAGAVIDGGIITSIQWLAPTE